MVHDLNMYKVPKEWNSFYLSSKPLLSWLEDLNKRVEQI